MWVQEEPGNQGAWHRIQHYLVRHMRPEQVLAYALRPSSAAPAVGYLVQPQSPAKGHHACRLRPARGQRGESDAAATRAGKGARHACCRAQSRQGEEMLVEVKVPALSESVSSATLVSWHKQPGEYVERDANLIDIETDKVVLELPAPEAGLLVKIAKGDGETVLSNEVIATIDTDAKPAAGAAPAVVPMHAPQPIHASAPAAEGAARVVMPAAKKIAAEQGIDTTALQGTGRGGRVTKGDVLASVGSTAQPVAKPAAAPEPVPAPVALSLGGRPEQRVPMTRLRKRVAERLVQSQSTAAILTTFNEVNMAPVMELRKRYQERFEKNHGVKLGFMSFFVKAAVAALKRYPVVNASVDGDDIIYHGYYDVGIAVGSERGLVVPIIRNADALSLADIEKQIADFGARAKSGKITLEELTGGTFSISNGGVFGSMLSTPIINPPQSAILGIHATKERPVAENGQVVIRPINYLATLLRSPHHRWSRGGAPGDDQGGAGGSGAPAAGRLRAGQRLAAAFRRGAASAPGQTGGVACLKCSTSSSSAPVRAAMLPPFALPSSGCLPRA